MVLCIMRAHALGQSSDTNAKPPESLKLLRTILHLCSAGGAAYCGTVFIWLWTRLNVCTEINAVCLNSWTPSRPGHPPLPTLPMYTRPLTTITLSTFTIHTPLPLLSINSLGLKFCCFYNFHYQESLCFSEHLVTLLLLFTFPISNLYKLGNIPPLLHHFRITIKTFLLHY